MQNNLLFDMALDKFMSSPYGEKLEEAFTIINKVQENLYALVTNQDGEDLLKQKIGTALVFALIGKAKGGKRPKDFSADDWKDVANAVSDLAIVGDGQKYSEFVFLKYAEYIDFSVNSYGELFSETTCDMIKACSVEILAKTELLQSGEIKEVDYIEDCLWISLDAMVKLLSAYLGALAGKDYSDLTRAIGMLAFEYGRYALFKQEQEIVTQYLDNQKVLDGQLEDQYKSFMQEMEKNSSQFQDLVGKAFESDFREQLMGSLKLAKAVGVDESQLLKNVSDVDDFFL